MGCICHIQWTCNSCCYKYYKLSIPEGWLNASCRKLKELTLKPTPPPFALKLMRWFCREDYIDEIEGDLTEIFEVQCLRSPVRAKWNFLWTVLRHFRPEFIKTTQGKKPNATTMIRHNLLLTIRHYKKAKTSFLVNFLSLFIGLTSTLLIYLWVQDELKIDGFHTNRDRLVQILQNDRNPSNVSTEPYTPGI
ncbi:MAG: permease prefix domain 2-containing transporter, partial [Bacteroidota bacterium]